MSLAEILTNNNGYQIIDTDYLPASSSGGGGSTVITSSDASIDITAINGVANITRAGANWSMFPAVAEINMGENNMHNLSGFEFSSFDASKPALTVYQGLSNITDMNGLYISDNGQGLGNVGRIYDSHFNPPPSATGDIGVISCPDATVTVTHTAAGTQLTKAGQQWATNQALANVNMNQNHIWNTTSIEFAPFAQPKGLSIFQSYGGSTLPQGLYISDDRIGLGNHGVIYDSFFNPPPGGSGSVGTLAQVLTAGADGGGQLITNLGDLDMANGKNIHLINGTIEGCVNLNMYGSLSVTNSDNTSNKIVIDSVNNEITGPRGITASYALNVIPADNTLSGTFLQLADGTPAPNKRSWQFVHDNSQGLNNLAIQYYQPVNGVVAAKTVFYCRGNSPNIDVQIGDLTASSPNVYVQGTLGNGRVYDTLYNVPSVSGFSQTVPLFSGSFANIWTALIGQSVHVIGAGSHNFSGLSTVLFTGCTRFRLISSNFYVTPLTAATPGFYTFHLIDRDVFNANVTASSTMPLSTTIKSTSVYISLTDAANVPKYVPLDIEFAYPPNTPLSGFSGSLCLIVIRSNSASTIYKMGGTCQLIGDRGSFTTLPVFST